ncbi:MAG TPA: cell division protein FtsZ [Candidatus Hydrogenedens sp.]|nr:cell division protein FtsZ [Candidatus Hydrogenedens sp.]HOK10147.1 cell division protein FtsZ [Candidatus Hydrogenedens sp.]HOL19426.1 cell division protein FtsZ [Candidatus Hydrogenedens sp.]HPP58255.1 cell division protein FtsZ [Candidatus Hydrogenedens sp.]
MTQRFTLIDPENYEEQGKKVETQEERISPPVHGFSGVMTGKEDFPGKKILIKVCGVGGGGGNAVERMIEQKMEEVEFIAINTDYQALSASPAPIKIQIGARLTDGLGTGSIPEVGLSAAEEDRGPIREALEGAHMVFLTAGMGGGTGTGAAPIVAEIAKQLGALTVAVVTFPFEFEGPKRRRDAYEGIKLLKEHVDALIVIPNDRVVALKDLTVKEAFLKVDEVLHNGIRAITDLIKIRQLINIDFADVRTILQNSGRAHLGIGFARGEKRAEEAVLRAIECNLLDCKSVVGAKGAILNIHGGSDMKIDEVHRAGNKLREILGPQANIIFGAMVGREPREEICITVIAAGFPEEQKDNEFIPKTITNISNIDLISPVENDEKIDVQLDESVNKKSKETPVDDTIKNKKEGELFPEEVLNNAEEEKRNGKPTLNSVPTWIRQYVKLSKDEEEKK